MKIIASQRRYISLALATGMALCLTFAGDAQVPAITELSSGTTAGIWRDGRHDGANCLYLLLRLNEVGVPYSDIEAAVDVSGGSAHFGRLLDTGRRYLPAVDLRRCTLRDIASWRRPVIVHLDSLDGQEGHFAFLLHVGKESCSVIDGASACFTEVDHEQFQRAWSGYALVVEQRPPVPLPTVMIGLACGAAILFYEGWWRRRQLNRRIPTVVSRSEVNQCQAT